MTGFWNNIKNAKFGNEADVELRLVIPLLHALGYNDSDIRSKYPVVFQEGRKGRRPEADFVVFYGTPHNKNTSLIVVEAKAPDESFGDAKRQGESYASNIRAPFLLLTDGNNLEIWQLQSAQESECILRTSILSLCSVRGQVEACLAKDAAFAYCRSLYHKNMLDVTEDFGGYEIAELNRTTKYQRVIERTLSNHGGNQEIFHNSRSLSDRARHSAYCMSNGFLVVMMLRFLNRLSLF
ncbi:MAG: type I restriction enzyme HsdR N-terminal domain-containing protein, partial [Methylobacter tundripaludum]|nr:type I restriction enzyme HsdR N-terminal domain-containing protein [Methylobacter tundripaludum]